MTRQRHPETINSKFIDYILNNNYNELADYDKKLLPKLKSRDNKITPIYKKGGIFLNDRNWCLKGYAGLSRKTRNTLAYQHYDDLDISGSVYAVLVYLGRKYNIDIPNIEDHFENRAIYLKSKMNKGMTRDEAKKIYTQKPFDNYDDWFDKSKMSALETEIAEVQTFIWEHDDFKTDRFYLTKKGQRIHSGNPKGKLLAHVYFTTEWAIVEKAMDFLESRGVFPVADIHDGFFIPKKTEKSLIKEMNLFIQNECDYQEISFIRKEMKDFLNIEKAIIEDFETHGNAVSVIEYNELKTKFDKIVGFCNKTKKFIEIHSDGTFTNISKEDLVLTYDSHYMFKDNNSFSLFTPKPSSFIRNWLSDPQKKTYDDITFIPSTEDTPPRLFNTFMKGFFVEYFNPEMITNADHDDLNIILNHIKELTSDGTPLSSEMYEYVLDWLAHLFQHPTERMNQMIIFKSGEGIGKTMFIDFIGSMMAHDNKEKYLLKVSDPDKEVFASFNDRIDGKMLVCFEELSKNNRFYDLLKDFITRDSAILNAKYQQPRLAKLFYRVMATTNNENCIQVSDTNRRFVPIESKREKLNIQEIQALVKAFKNPVAKKLFYNALLKRDISSRDFNDFPKSELYNRLLTISNDPVKSFIIDYFNIDRTFSQYKNDDYVAEKNFYTDYIEYCTEYKFSYINRRDFFIRVSSIGECFKSTYHGKKQIKIIAFDFISVRNYLRKRGYKINNGLDSGNGTDYTDDEEEETDQTNFDI